MGGREGAVLRCAAAAAAALELDRGGGGARKEVGLVEDGRGAEGLEGAGKGTGWWHWREMDLL